MRYTVQYIPLNKITPGVSAQITQRIRELRKIAQDCMHLLIVRKNRKQGNFIIISGNNHYEYFKRHTKKKAVPCLLDESKASSAFSTFISFIRKRKLPLEAPYLKPNGITPNSWQIIRAFLKQDPRFKQLSRSQQLKVLRIGLQYKKTTMISMKAKVTELLGK